MTKSEFWKIIERSKRGAASARDQAEELERLLDALPSKQVLAFERIFTKLLYAAYRWDLWGVAYLLCQGCGDDDFDYFRAWLIGRGQQYYEEAMTDPESVARKVTEGDWPSAEFLMYAASKAYEKKNGHDFPLFSFSHPKKPAGRNWKEEDLPQLFPIAHKKKGICG